MSNLPHHHLPSPFDRYASMVLLEEVEHADYYLLVNLGLLVLIAIFQLKMFARPPPVPLKKLPQRPALSILFKPDDITSISTLTDSHSVSSGTSRLNSNFSRTSSSFDVDPIIETVKEVLSSVPPPPAPRRFSASSGSAHSVDEDHIEMETPGKPSYDLPDSFAPLLSSSQTEMLLHQLTADLIHGIHAEASVRMREGRHEIPLDKDRSRPQFVVDIPKGGIRLSAVASVGSDRFSTAQDLNVAIPTTSRSQPMLKHAGLVFDPPLPLLNVAPTLIHFPTLFEDNTVVPKLRSIQIIRFFVDAVIAINSWIEKLLWIIESFLQIHLSKVRITPLYKGRSSLDDTSPEWRLTLAFSGHCLLCGVIPIPFISVILPTFIIPQPHALLEYLLSKQPLASARIRRENIAEQRIALAVLDTADSWNCKVEAVATPPAVGIDLTLTGGLSLGLELMHGRDPIAGRTRKDAGDASYLNHSKDTFPESLGGGAGNRGIPPPSSGASMSSWTTNDDSGSDLRRRASFPKASNTQPFDANNVVPWKFNFHAKGSINKEKMSFHLLNCSFQHEDASTSSQFQTRGSFAVWRAANDIKSEPSNLAKPYAIRRSASFAHRAALASANETPSVAEIFLFPDDTEAFHRDHSMLQYDYAFDISEDSKLDALTFSVGANHPMLNGGSMVTTILESIYAFGSVSARKHAVLDPMERKRKRNILRHLPAIDFTFGIQNSYIPPESHSYTDDGQARSLPAMEGGRIMVRFLGGIQEEKKEQEIILMPTGDIRMSESESPVAEGIKVVADVGFSSIVLNSETSMKEFPELEIFEGAKLRALTSGKLGGYIKCHLRPQKLASSLSTTGPNIFNPLEAYEIDFSGSSFSVRLKESSTSLGHRRIIMPAETTIKVKVVESIVDMAMEGMSECEFSWDFQGLSPILQVTEVGFSPEDVNHEKKEQVSLLIAPLRQGRLNFHVSPVGGINITKAATSREDKEGLYDWKFFNALVSSDQQSTERLVDVINDKRTMNKLLQVIKLINSDGHRVLNWILTQVWRAKDILDQEGISDPKHIIPGHRMARLVSLLLCGDLSQVVVILPIIRRVTTGDGLDVVAVKELLRQHCEFYEDWTPELDRAVRWVEVMFTPFTVPPPFVENHVVPLAEQPHHFSRFKAIPSAAQLYDHLHDRPHLPLDRSFSNLVGRVAPYLSFNQIEYFLKVRSSKDWQPSDLKRLRYVYSVKRKVMDIAESYGGLSFLPQSFLVSVFLGEATRASLRVTQRSSHQATEPGSGTRYGLRFSSRPSTLLSLRHRRARLQDPILGSVPEENPPLSAAARVASVSNFLNQFQPPAQNNTGPPFDIKEEDSSQYELGDCLLGPADVAALLQAGLASVMKGSSVVQLNQRMLLDLIASQPESFAIAVLAEIGTSGGQGGSPQQLTSGKTFSHR